MRLALVSLLLALAAASSHAELAVQEAVEALEAESSQRIATGDYEHLLADIDHALQSQERLADGRWKLAILMGGATRGFKAAERTDEDWTRSEAALRALAGKHPRSPNAWLLLASLENAHAWALRGGGYANSVTPAMQAAFRDHLGRALAVLDQHKTPGNPAWYELRIDVGGAIGEGPDFLDRVFDEAIKREPDYQQTWFIRLHYLEPRWGGSLEEMARLVNRAAATPTKAEGRGLMGRLLWIATASNYPGLMLRPEIDWQTVKASYDDVLKHYPDDWNAQWFFMEACRHSDKPAATRFLAFAKGAPSPALLAPNMKLYAKCQDWASGNVPYFILRDPETGEQTLIR